MTQGHDSTVVKQRRVVRILDSLRPHPHGHLLVQVNAEDNITNAVDGHMGSYIAPAVHSNIIWQDDVEAPRDLD